MTEQVNFSDDLLVGFVEESIDALQALPNQLDEFRRNPRCADPINAVFRSVHSIKGNAGFFNLAAIKRFAHSLENTLDDVRHDKLTLNEELQRALVRGFDRLGEMLQGVSDGHADDDLLVEDNEILEAVAAACGTASPVEADPELQLLTEVRKLIGEMRSASLPQAADWANRLQRFAVDETAAEEMPAEESAPVAPPVTPADCFVGTTIVVQGEDITELVRHVAEPMAKARAKALSRDEGKVWLEHLAELDAWTQLRGHSPLGDAVTAASRDLTTLLQSPLDLDATLLSIVWDRISPELCKVAPPPAKEAAKETAKEEAATEKQAESKPGESKPDPAKAEPAAKARMVRVREDRIDGFLDDVSSLFITCERFKDVHSRMAGHGSTQSLVDELRQVNVTLQTQTARLQKSVVALRKVPAEGLLSKFPRMARQLADKLGKRIEVQLQGTDCEIDKSLSEELDSPLTHMIRNVCDHAIETPEDRALVGKPETGSLNIKCELTRTSVVFSVKDDGRGIDPHRLRRKVVEKGILTSAQAEALSDQEAIELIFHPGFSTAEQISEVSGRGVGLDVVRTTLREHHGDIKVESRIGQGTTFRLEIPLRQAVLVIDGLVVEALENTFVIPFGGIREIVEIPPENRKSVQGETMAVIRGRPYAAVSLADALQLSEVPVAEMEGAVANEVDSTKTTCGVLMSSKHGELCLLVDRVLGQRKIVVNSLDNILDCTEQIQGVAQMGAGRLALVLNAAEMIRGLARGPVATA